MGLNPIFTFTAPELTDGLVTIEVQAQEASSNWSVIITDIVTVDANVPVGSLNINNGGASTTTNNVILNLFAEELSGVTGYRVANGLLQMVTGQMGQSL